MATLTGQSIASSYEQLLHVDTDGGGNTTTLVPIKDGDNGTTFAAQLSTTTICIDNPTTSSSSQGGILRLQSDDGAALGDTHRLGVIEFGAAEDGSNTITTGARIEAIADAAWSASENGADMVFYTTDGNASQSEVMRLTADNLVGIGTAAPLGILHLDSTSTTNLKIEGTNTGTTLDTVGHRSGSINLYNTGVTNDNYMDIGFWKGASDDSGFRAAQIVGQISSHAGGSGYLHFRTSTSSTLQTRMTLDSSGNVGINESSPAHKLEVGGDIGVAGNYILEEQGRQDHVANTMPAPYYRFDGVDDYVNTNETFQTTYRGDFSIAMMIKVIDGNPSAVESLWGASEADTNDRVYMSINTNGTVELKYKDGSTQLAPTTTSAIFTDGENPWKHIVVVIDAVNNLALFYDNGTSVAVTNSDLSSLDFSTIALTQNAVIGARNQAGLYGHFDGSISDVKIFNKALTAAEVKELYSGASVPYKYKGANQTNMVTTAADGDFSGAGNWTSNGNHTATITGGEMVVVASDASNGSSNAVSLAGSNFDDTGGIVGKAYNYRFKARASTGTPTLRARTPFEWTGGNTEDFTLSTTMQSFEISAKVKIQNENAYFALLESGGGTFYIDDVELVPAGAVAEYDGSGVGASRWDDKSGNELHGTVSGATVENAPADADSGLTYEEGTWTPQDTDLGGSVQSGMYTKIGNLVTCHFTLTTGAISGGSLFYIKNLPFTCGATDAFRGAVSIAYTNATNMPLGGNVTEGATTAYLLIGTGDIATDDEIGSSKTIAGSMMYRVD